MEHDGPLRPAAARIDVRLLGGFDVAVGGALVPDERWAGVRAMQLVQLLCLSTQRHLPRDQVIETLWPHLDPDAGAANLRKAAFLVRQSLGIQDSIVLQSGQVLFAPELDVHVDVSAFEAAARAALQAGDPVACASASSLYAGDLLPDSRYEEWTAPARERLRDLQATLLRSAGDWEALAAFDPTDEAAHRALMEKALADGNRSVAIRWYARLRDALQQGLGVAPSPETQQLYRHAAEVTGRPEPPLLGREPEQVRIQDWLGQAGRNAPAGVFLHGPGGIGKSALSREAANAARVSGWTVVSVTAVLPGLPYGTLSVAVEQMLLANRDLLDVVGAPARAVLARLTPLAEPAQDLPGPLGRHQVIGAFRRLLLASAHGGQVMLQVDDAHLLDDAEVEVMLHLVTTGPPLWVWLAARPPDPDSVLARGVARLIAGQRCRDLVLAPLSAADVRALIARAAPAPVASEAAGRIVALSDGNPFVALELASSAAPLSPRLPATVAEAIVGRLCDVPESVRDLLRLFALANDEVDVTMAVALAPEGEPAALAALDAALRSDTLVVADARYRFRHELVRQALLDQVPPHRRLSMHRAIAERLARVDLSPALVARHWLAGGCPGEAVPWLLAAAKKAVHVAAFSDALRYLDALLAHDSRHRAALTFRARALDALGDARAVAAYHLAAEVEGGPLADDLLAMGALAQIKQGDAKGAVQALQGLSPVTTEGRLSEALTYSGAAALGAVGPALGSAKSAEARRLALASGDQAALVVASWAHAAAAHARGELHRTVHADLRDTSQLPHLAMRVFDGQLCMVQRLLYGARPYPEVIAFAQGLADEARRLGARRGEAFGVTIRGEAELLAGDLDDAERHLAQGRDLHRAVGGLTGESFALQRLAEVSMHRGQLDEAYHRLEQALDLARQSDVGFHLLDRIYGARIALAGLEGDARWALDDALQAVRGPLETCPGCRITFAVPAAIAAARAGDLDQAEGLEQQSAYLAQVVMRLPAWHGAHAEVRGELARARGLDAKVAREHFDAAARLFRQAGQPLDVQRCEASNRALGS
ncbi:MAG: AAA family ATPase [Burkholderiaceae bacterium]